MTHDQGANHATVMEELVQLRKVLSTKDNSEFKHLVYTKNRGKTSIKWDEVVALMVMRILVQLIFTG